MTEECSSTCADMSLTCGRPVVSVTVVLAIPSHLNYTLLPRLYPLTFGSYLGYRIYLLTSDTSNIHSNLGYRICIHSYLIYHVLPWLHPPTLATPSYLGYTLLSRLYPPTLALPSYLGYTFLPWLYPLTLAIDYPILPRIHPPTLLSLVGSMSR